VAPALLPVLPICGGNLPREVAPRSSQKHHTRQILPSLSRFVLQLPLPTCQPTTNRAPPAAAASRGTRATLRPPPPTHASNSGPPQSNSPHWPKAPSIFTENSASATRHYKKQSHTGKSQKKNSPKHPCRGSGVAAPLGMTPKSVSRKARAPRGSRSVAAATPILPLTPPRFPPLPPLLPLLPASSRKMQNYETKLPCH
jgi:hypothetical protein